MTTCTQKLCEAEAEIEDLRAALRAEDEETSVDTRTLMETECLLREQKEQHENQEFEREAFMHDILLANKAMEWKDVQKEEEIAILGSQLAV
jgi:hypothetical protein